MRKFVITNINGNTVHIRPYTIVGVLHENLYDTDVEGVVLYSLEKFKIGETVVGREMYSEVKFCRGMVECA